MPLPENWQPAYDEEQARRLLEYYKGKAHILSPEKQEELQRHAEAYNIPYYTGDFSLLDAIGQLGAGFVEGFTTLNIADHPDNEYEGIARSMGHLIGFVPGILSGPAMAAGKLLKWQGARGFAAAAANLKSLPMRGADFLKKHAKQAVRSSTKGFVGRSKAMQTTKNFLMGEKAKHVIDGAFTLGAASGLSAWQGGVDQMMNAGISGAVAGGYFRAIGNLIPGTAAHAKVSKAIAGSLFMGLPATNRGATTPEQVYEYMMGAYFGGKEISWSRAGAHKAMKKIGEKAKDDPEWAGRSGMDVELWEGYDKLPEEVKPILKEEALKAWGSPDANREGWIAYKLIEELQQEGKVTEEELIEKGYAFTGEYKEGDKVYRADPEMVRQQFKAFVTSGGAIGADTKFAKEANRMGIPTIHYTFGAQKGKIKAVGFQRMLSQAELDEADTHVRDANLSIGKNTPIEEGSRNLQRRNWYQVKWADSVYAVGEFEKPQKRTPKGGDEIFIKRNTQVKGGTGLTVQMGIDNGKPVFFFNQVESQWYKWNKGAGQFTTIKEPPKPTARFAGVGTRDINKAGRKAIEDLFDQHWIPTVPATEKVAVEALKGKERQTAKALEVEIDKSQDLYNELKDEVIVLKAQGGDSTLLETKMNEVSLENQTLTERYNRLVNVKLHQQPISTILNKEVVESEISDKADTDFEGPSELEVGKRSMQFANKHLDKVILGAPNVMEGQRIKGELANIVQDTLTEADANGKHIYLRKGTQENLSEQWADSVETKIRDTYGFTGEDPKAADYFELGGDARSEMRQWMTRKNTGNIVYHLQSDGKNVFFGKNPDAPVSLAGNRKHQEEPIKAIEIAYKQAGGLDKAVYMVLDHVTITGEKGRQDITLNNFRQSHLLKKNKYDERLAAREYNEFVGKAMKSMAKKGYYLFGGKADADRMYWVKYNPHVTELSGKEVRSELKSVEKEAVTKHKDFRKQLKVARKEFIDRYGASLGVMRDVGTTGTIQMQPDHMQSISGGTKQLTSRSDSYHQKFYKGDGTYKMPNGEQVELEHVKNNLIEAEGRESFTVEEMVRHMYEEGIADSEVGIKDEFARLEGFEDWANMEATARPETKKWMQGQGYKNLYKLRYAGKAKVTETGDAETLFDKIYLSNIKYDLQMNGMEFTPENIRTILTHPGFIKNSAAYNKRLQIWMNNAWAGDRAFIHERVGGINPLNERGNYRYVIVSDLSQAFNKMTKAQQKSYQSLVTRLNNETSEHIDGGIIVSDKVLDAINADFGVPDSGQNKSFIVSPHPKRGAILGKYMLHGAGPEMSKIMDKANLHMIMQESAIKQRGTRQEKLRRYDIVNGELDLKGAKIYGDLAPEHVMGNFSVYGNKHFMENQRVPKQLLQALLPNTWNPTKQEVVDGAFDDIIYKRWMGDDAVNKRVDSYLERAGKKVLTQEELIELETDIIKNIDNIGIEKLVEAMKSETTPGLTEAIYNKILKIDKNLVMDEYLEGNLTEEDYKEHTTEVNEFNSIVDRITTAAGQWAAEQRAAGVEANVTSVYMHKFIRDFRVRAVQNFLINSATKPLRKNSAVGFMRPYDRAMQLDLDNANPLLRADNKEGINYKDDLFFLDNHFQSVKINLNFEKGAHQALKQTTLGRLWEMYKQEDFFNKEEKVYIEDVLEAITMRVPMDSMSGAQVLKFSGFTGRKGHGIVLHGRAMKAEGGADLDGDKSFIFFGGEGGMRNEWKEAYKSNKKEFYRTKKTTELIPRTGGLPPLKLKKETEQIADNKEGIILTGKHKGKMYRDPLSISPSPEREAELTSKAFQYSPAERIRISEAAVSGRQLLGPAVNQKQLMSAAYNAIIANGGKDTIFMQLPGKKRDKKGFFIYETYKVKIKARTDKKSQADQRGIGRAQVGLASDPLDELGLTGQDAWFRMLWNAHFKIDGKPQQVFSGRKRPVDIPIDEFMKKFSGSEPDSRYLRGGIFGDLANVNKAYWGRNWATGRKWNMLEIQAMGNKIGDIPTKAQDASIMSKTGKMLQGLDWSDSIFAKISEEALTESYTVHKGRLDEFDWMKGLLGRPSFKVTLNPYVKTMLSKQFKLWTSLGIEKTADNHRDFIKAIKGTIFENQVFDNPRKYFRVSKEGRYTAGDSRQRRARRDLLIEFRLLSEDFVVNDMSDIASLTNISEILETMVKARDTGFIKPGLNLQQAVEDIHKKGEFLKRKSYLMTRDRRSMEKYDADVMQMSEANREKINELFRVHFAYEGVKESQQKRALGDEITAEMNQDEIDIEIFKYKEGLTSNGKRLFDQLMLGSINRGKMEAIEKFERGVKEWDPFTIDVIKGLRSEASRTSVSKLGFNSNAISDTEIKFHIGSFATQFKEAYRAPSTEQAKEFADKADKYEPRIGEDEMDPAFVEALVPSGYAGIKKAPKGKLDPESQKLAVEIADMLKTLNNKHGQDINEIARGIVGKDLNAMNKHDYQILRNWFHDMKRGNLIQRMFHKDGPVELNKRHWAFFPKAINREIMRDDIVMMRQKGFFQDKLSGKMQPGIISRPTHYLDIIQNFIAKMSDSATGVSDKYIKRFQDSMQFHAGIEDSGKLWEIAVRQRENHYSVRDQIKNSKKTSSIVKERSLREIATRMGETERENNWNPTGGKGLKQKEYIVSVIEDGVSVRKTMTGEQVVERINGELDGLFKEMKKFITGDPDALDAYRFQNPKRGMQYDYKKFIRHLQEHLAGTSKRWAREGIVDVPSHFGIDGLRRIARSMMIDMQGGTSEYRKLLAREPVIGTGQIGTEEGEGYFPHMFFDKATSKKVMKEALEKIVKLPESEMTEEDKKLEIKKLIYKNKSLGGEWHFEDLEEWDLVDQVLEDISKGKKMSESHIKHFNPDERAGAMKSREVHMAGWSIDPVVVESYVRSLSNTYHRQLSQMFGREMTDKMYGQMVGKWGKEQAVAWQNFAKLYVQDSIGNPSIIPERIWEQDVMKLKGTPYAWFADNRVRDRLNKFANALGLGNKAIPEDMRNVDIEMLRNWSNLEAQYEMASLLAHPKSMVANIFGGVTHTIQSAGWGNFVKGKSMSYLSKINPKWKTKKDIDDFVIGQGVIPEFMMYEMGLQKEFQNTKGKKFLEELGAKFTRDPDMSQKTFTEIASKHGIKDKIMNFAAKFMTVPERMLRRDAFMAHYIQAWDHFGGAIKEYDHPFLIEIAKKGVKATQFLYNAPHRPAFARTALGKMVSRFQLWAWNSVRFRNDVRRQARIYGFKPGTEEWRRFERTLQTDLVVFGLANIYAYSIFENNLPQPWGWIQDWADWIFGDEKERDKAFYGAWPTKVAPLQMVTPPGLRMVGPVFNAMLNDDWSRVAQYNVWTMFPFGRMARDIAPWAPGNLIENPGRIFEKIGGIPVQQYQRKLKAWKENKPPVTYAKGPIEL